MKKILFTIIALGILASCSGGGGISSKGYTITEDGVGPYVFGKDPQEITMDGYITSQDPNRKNMTFVIDTLTNTNVIINWEGNSMWITGSEFKTKQGVHTGMLLTEAEKILGKLQYIKTSMSPEGYMFIRENSDERIGYSPGNDMMNGSLSERSELRRNPSKITVTDFKPETKIMIIIFSGKQ